MEKGSSKAELAGMSCLVLGAGGFIGTNLCRTLLARGARVQGFGRARPFADALFGVQWTSGNFVEHEDLARLVEGNDFVFHLIGGSLPESSNKNPAANVSANILSSVNLLEVCRLCGVRRVLFVSSGGTVYGITGSEPIAETAPTEPISAYGINKLTIEKYLSLYRYLYDLDYAVLRLANPYGPFQTAHRRQGVVAALAQRALSGDELEIWGDGTVVRDFVHVQDVVEGMVAVLGYQGPNRVFNIGSGVGRSVNAIVADLEALLGRALPKTYRKARRADVPVNVLDIGLIQRETGWKPRIGWMDGLQNTVDWLADNG
jgi:UDP-glucose 4-epimerase